MCRPYECQPQRPRVWENHQFVLKIRRTRQAVGDSLILAWKIEDFLGEAVGGRILIFPKSNWNLTGLDVAVPKIARLRVMSGLGAFTDVLQTINI